MNFFTRFFSKKKIKFRGRGGIEFKSDNGNVYKIDGEFLPNEAKEDIIIYPKDITFKDESRELTEKEKEPIIGEVIEDLEKQGLKVLIHKYR